jgi:RimJ/RimL family protein N-acetyltransferase
MVEDPTSVSVAVCGPDGTPLGLANYLRIDPANGCVEVGNILLGRALQRTVAATEAMHLLAAHVFDDLGYRRYEWKCDALNALSQAAATRLGFRYEGTFRQAVVYKGRNRDTAWFSITDRDWPRVAAAHRAWLAPTNFAGDGTQRRSLSDLTSEGADPGLSPPHGGTAIPYLGT